MDKETVESSVAREVRMTCKDDREHVIPNLVHIIRRLADICGYEIEGRITFVDKKTGEKFE